MPPELAGREALLASVAVAIARLRAGRASKSVVMLGLRGVGKTVLLDRMRADAERSGARAVRIEAPEDRSLPALLAPELRTALLALSRAEQASDLARRALRALAGFVTALRVKFRDIDVGIDFEREPGLADNGDLEHDLAALLEACGEAAKAGDTILAIFADELQYVREAELAALITALHRTAQRALPVVLVAAGLPQLRGRMGRAKSYAERLFDFSDIAALKPEAARQAIVKPALVEGVDITVEAVDRIISETQGYPYFLQEWGKHAWNVAARSPIDIADVEAASITVQAALDASFFRVRLERLSPAERRYLRAMAELGAGPHRSGDIAAELDRQVTALGPTRAALIDKGMIYGPNHGETAFTVPLFDDFMRRIMRGDRWRTE
jgi:hypothetical protein